MTYMGLLAIIAIIIAVVGSSYAFISYLKLKYTNPDSYETRIAKLDIFKFAISPFFGAVCFWAISIVLLAFIFGNTPINIYTRTVVNSEEEIIIFEEQNDDEYIITIDGKQYICTSVVINSEIENAQVKFVDCERADNFIADFFMYELATPKDTYELHIPTSYLGTS